METIGFTWKEIADARESKQVLFTCEPGKRYTIKLCAEIYDEIHFLDPHNNPLQTQSFDVILVADGSENVVRSEGHRVIIPADISQCPEWSMKLPEKTIKQLGQALETEASGGGDSHSGQDDESRIKTLFLREKLSEETIAFQNDSRPPFKVRIKPYSLMARMTGMHFDTSKCFMLPSALPGLRNMVDLYRENAQTVLMLVGHTDTAGSTEYNDSQSLERAQSVAAFLTDDVDWWLSWYENGKPNEKRWGDREDGMMLSAVLGDQADKTVGAFQVWHNNNLSEDSGKGSSLKEDGIVGPKTRSALIARYMEQDGTTLPEDITLLTHGCGEHFPLDVSEKELDSSPVDGEYDITDRRVELFFFDKKDGVSPPPPGKNSSAGSTEYVQWRERARVVYVGTPAKDSLIINLLDDSMQPVAAGTRYRVSVNATVREGVLSVPGQIIEMGIMLDDADEAQVQWGSCDQWTFGYPKREDPE